MPTSTAVQLTITDRDLTRGLALANTPSGEVVIHIKDARIPLWTEGEKLPFISRTKLFLHSDTSLPEVGDVVVAQIHQGREQLYAYWCPEHVWDYAKERFQVTYKERGGKEYIVWQGKGILNLSVLFRSSQVMTVNGTIHSGNEGSHRLSIIDDATGEEFVPEDDPRLTPDVLPWDLIDGTPSYFADYKLAL